MSFTDEENKNIENQDSAKQKRVILTSADQIPDEDVVDILRGKKRITEVHFEEAPVKPAVEPEPEVKAPRTRKRKTAVVDYEASEQPTQPNPETFEEISFETFEEPKPKRRAKAVKVEEINLESLEEPKPKSRAKTAKVEEISLESLEEPKPKSRAKTAKVEEISLETLEEPKPKRRSRAVLVGGETPELQEKPRRRARKVEASEIDEVPVNPEVNINISDAGYTESTVAASLEETAAVLRNRIFGEENSKRQEDLMSETQRVKMMSVIPQEPEVRDLSEHDVLVDITDSADHHDNEVMRVANRRSNMGDTSTRIPVDDIELELEQVENNGGTTARYNSEMVIEELRHTEPEERYHVQESEFRRERRHAMIGGFRPISTSWRVYPYGIEEIPEAVSQLTKRAKLNETHRVTSRAKKLEKAGRDGRIEPNCEEVITFEFEGMSNSHVPLDHDSIFFVDGEDGYQDQRPHRRPPATRGHSKKRGSGKSKRKPHGVAFRIISALLLVLIIFICVFGYDFAKKVCDDRPMDAKDLSKITYTVDENTTDDEVAAFLVEHNMVESELYYKLRAILFDADYKPGTYEISPSYSTEKIINILSGYDYSAGT